MAKTNVKERADFQEDMARMVQKYYEKGYEEGYTDAMDSLKAAVSDGLRKGSGKCGEALRRFKK